MSEKTREEIENLATIIVDSMVHVHRELGPGLLESTYQACLQFELATRGIKSEVEQKLPVRYKGLLIEAGFRLDMLVENCILVENKSLSEVPPVCMAQTITYMKLTGVRLAFLVNWNVPLIKDGIQRIVRNL